MSINYRGAYEITITKEYPNEITTTSLHLDDISGLPDAIKALAGSGVDLSATAEALRQIEEERRVKEEQRAGALMAKLKEKAVQGAVATKTRRFTVARAKKDVPGQCTVADGVEFGKGGRVYIKGFWDVEGSYAFTLDFYKTTLEARGEVYHIEFVD